MNLWVLHPRSKQPDSALTFSVLAVLATLGKFLLNGVTIEVLNKTVNFGTIDAALVGAILAPTLGAYVARKFKDSPDTKKEDSK